MRCPQHPDRPVLDAYVCTKRRCAECYDNAARDYADWQTNREREAGGFYAYHAQINDWLYGAGDMPVHGRTNIKEKK